MVEKNRTIQLENLEETTGLRSAVQRDPDENEIVSRRSTPGTPRWVKVLGIVIIGLVLLFAVLHLSGRSPIDHMNHMSPTGQGMQMP